MALNERLVVTILRWTARTVGAAILILIAILAIGDVGQGGPNPLHGSWRENLLGVALWTMVLGQIVAWKWEGIGSLLILGAFVLFATVNRPFRFNIVYGTWLLLGLLYLTCWWRGHGKNAVCRPSPLADMSVMESLKIILVCILSAVAYGILHDQVTARVCVEYFTIGHPPIFHTESPTLLAIGWGIFATWWMGLILGVLAALASQAGAWPKMKAVNLARPIGGLLIVMAVTSLLAGIAGYQMAKAGGLMVPQPLASRILAAHHSVFLADLLAHQTAYAVGFFGGLMVCGLVLVRRWRMGNSLGSPGRNQPP
jgi:hypothetical protein